MRDNRLFSLTDARKYDVRGVIHTNYYPPSTLWIFDFCLGVKLALAEAALAWMLSSTSGSVLGPVVPAPLTKADPSTGLPSSLFVNKLCLPEREAALLDF